MMADNPNKPTPSARLAELACQAVDILIPVAEGSDKITYTELGERLVGGVDPHTGLAPVLRYLHWHGVVPLGLPMLTAVVVRVDTRRPGKGAWDAFWESIGGSKRAPIGRDVQWRMVFGQVVSFSGWGSVAPALKDQLRSSLVSAAGASEG